MDWVIERMKVGYVDVVNPFNRNQVNCVSLNPNDVKCFVWWSKNFDEWIKAYNNNKDLFKSYKGHAFQFTINSPSELERNLNVTLEERFNQLNWLKKEFTLQSINFRYDPIIFYKVKGSNNVSNNLNKFKFIIKKVADIGIREIIFSFATIYYRVQKRMRSRGFIPIDLPLMKKKEILGKLIEVTDEYNMQMKACCHPNLLEVEGISQAHCIDANKIEQLIKEKIPKVKDTGQRKDCGCYKSKDIGGYSGIFQCKHNCDYCYASPTKR
jgi:DNA repair photolyase